VNLRCSQVRPGRADRTLRAVLVGMLQEADRYSSNRVTWRTGNPRRTASRLFDYAISAFENRAQ
jgi:hypothetical protein